MVRLADRRTPIPLIPLTTALIALLALSACPTSASFLPPFPSLRSRGLPATTHNASSSVTVTPPSSSQGRYGHSALYLPPPVNQLLLLGGQLDNTDTDSSSSSNTTAPELSSSVLTFNLGSTFLWGNRPVSAIPDNPRSDPTYSTSFPGGAFGAAAVAGNGSLWYIGGIATQPCDSATTFPALVFTQGANWTQPESSPRIPPRRRQASAVSVKNATTGGVDVWVFGGIAEQYTCSSDGSTVAYAGVDRYDTLSGTVETMAWSAPVNASQVWDAPVSDYSATWVEELGEVVVVGGQTAQGVLAPMDAVLRFEVATRTWAEATTLGETPISRMGHATTLLPSGSLLVHGGLSSTHSPLSDLYLLSPPSSSPTPADGPWTWTSLSISDSSMLSPSLAWHTATAIEGGTIVIAFGLDTTTAAASNDFYFLSIDEEAGTYTWQDTFDGNAEAVASSSSSESGTSTTRNKRALEVVVNPKADSYAVSTSHSASPAPDSTQQPAYYGNGGAPTQAAPSSSARRSSSSASLVVVSPSALSSSISPPASSSATPPSSSSSSSSPSKHTALAASLGAIGGAVALAGLLILLLRRRAAQSQQRALNAQAMTSSPPEMVSSLMYTRPVQRRMMSLGSTISPVPSRLEGEGEGHDGEGGGEWDDMAGVGAARTPTGGKGLGNSPDPFSDHYRVNEVGQLELHRRASRTSASSSTTTSTTGGVVGALKNSVQSIPFLSSVTLGQHQSDVYTSPALTLSSKRSLRRSQGSQTLPPLPLLLPLPLPSTSPVPPTPAELIGLAVTSDDGHGGSAASPIVQSKEKEEEGLAYLQGVPKSLRPGTPLRVANPDTFADKHHQSRM
ncbi:hypothetical protein JCM11641_005494 [Rhodosporidiobolus odoratus]